MPRVRAILPSLLLCLAGLAISCSDPAPATPTATATATQSPVPTWTLPPPTPTGTPVPTATPLPDLTPGTSIIVGGVVRTRAEPSTQSEQVGSIADLTPVTIVNHVQGENWLLGDQKWLTSTPEWASEWLQLDSGAYVYAPFVFVLGEGERSPIAPVPDGVEKWVDVDISAQTAKAMVGEDAVFTAPISSGDPAFPTPLGSFAVEPDGRIAVERMTASQAGYQQGQATYDVERVLFTQYFDQKGNALHLNYWRPSSVFGVTPTSHGCVGMQLHAAQYFWLFGAPGMRVEIHE